MFPVRVAEEGARLSKALEATVTRIEQEGLHEAALHYPRAGGKALRPALAAVACEACGGDASEADPLGLAVELLHTFSLVHDDLMDADDTRRGVPSVHTAYDEASAILAGDVLFALCFESLADLGAAPSTPDVLADLARTARTLCEGQAMDMAFEREWPSVETYETMIQKKTAALFASATGSAARIAGSDEPTVSAMTSYGRALGMAFQITDDVLDLAGDPDKLGKPIGSDIRAGKKTHPILLTHALAHPEQAAELEAILEGGTDETGVDRVMELCRSTGALAQSEQATSRHLEEARAALDHLDPSPAGDTLAEVLDWVAQRDR